MKDELTNRVMFSGFIPPDQLDRRALREYMDCGFNLCFMTENYYKVDSPEYFKALKLMEEMGLDACVTFYKNQTGTYHEHFKNVDLHDYPAVKFIHFIDEPWDELMQLVSDIYVPWYNEKYSDLGFFMNTYGSGYNKEGHYGSCDKLEKYEEHIDKCAKNISAKVKGNNKFFSIDSYPLRYEPGYWVKGIEAQPYLHGLVISSQRAKATNSKFGGCIQTFEGFNNCRYPDCVGDIRFQIFCQFAFGVKSLCFFTYKSEETVNYAYRGMITMKGRRTALYYHTRKAIAEVKTFDKEYMTYGWKGTTFVDGKVTNENEVAFKQAREQFGMNYSDDNVSAVSAEHDILLGCFEKEGGKCAYVITTYSEPSKEIENKISITFKKGQSLRINHNGVWMEETLIDGKFTLTVNNGDGLFIVLE